MDLSLAAQPRSDQLNADDLIGGPQIVTIAEVRRGNDEQPVEIVTEEFGPGRPYKPGKSMIRVLISAWGKEASTYTGRRLMLYRDPEISFGREKVGGIRISAMSDIPQRLTLALTVTRGRRAPFVVEPLPAGQPAITAEAVEDFARAIAEAATEADLAGIAADLKNWDLGNHKSGLSKAWSERKASLKAAAEPKADDQ